MIETSFFFFPNVNWGPTFAFSVSVFSEIVLQVHSPCWLGLVYPWLPDLGVCDWALHRPCRLFTGLYAPPWCQLWGCENCRWVSRWWHTLFWSLGGLQRANPTLWGISPPSLPHPPKTAPTIFCFYQAVDICSWKVLHFMIFICASAWVSSEQWWWKWQSR